MENHHLFGGGRIYSAILNPLANPEHQLARRISICVFVKLICHGENLVVKKNMFTGFISPLVICYIAIENGP